MWTLKISSQAEDFFNALTGKHHDQVAKALDLIAENPFCGKPLKGELKGYWSFRVGMYRIIYTIRNFEIIVEILRIQHRKEVYERMRR